MVFSSVGVLCLGAGRVAAVTMAEDGGDDGSDTKMSYATSASGWPIMKSVVDRYYTQLFNVELNHSILQPQIHTSPTTDAPLTTTTTTAATTTATAAPDIGTGSTAAGGPPFASLTTHDQYVHVHSNGICVVGLAPAHPILYDRKTVTRVNWDVSESTSTSDILVPNAVAGAGGSSTGTASGGSNQPKSTDRSKLQITGKRKKGGQALTASDVLCVVETSDGARYLIRSALPTGGRLIETNQRLTAEPNLITTSPHYAGYLGLFLLKKFELSGLMSAAQNASLDTLRRDLQHVQSLHLQRANTNAATANASANSNAIANSSAAAPMTTDKDSSAPATMTTTAAVVPTPKPVASAAPPKSTPKIKSTSISFAKPIGAAATAAVATDSKSDTKSNTSSAGSGVGGGGGGGGAPSFTIDPVTGKKVYAQSKRAAKRARRELAVAAIGSSAGAASAPVPLPNRWVTATDYQLLRANKLAALTNAGAAITPAVTTSK